MKRVVLIYGAIAGAIVTSMMVGSSLACYRDPEFVGNMWIGYSWMLLAFSFVFFGIKRYRDKLNGGYVTFGKAFQIGLFITLIASSVYTLTWLVEFYCFIPDFMEKYVNHVMLQARKEGISATELVAKQKEMAMYSKWYKNPALVIVMTYMEIVPLGLAVSLISAFALKKRPKLTD